MRASCNAVFAWSPASGHITLAVRVTPRAGRNAVEGLRTNADGLMALSVRVAAVPVDGAANDAVEAVVAKWLGIRPSDVEVTGGLTIRSKRLRIDGDPVALVRKLQVLTG